MRLLSAFSLLVILLFASCSRKDYVKVALDISGENRPELQKVLDHYSKDAADSLKLKAAFFLIANMPYHYTIEGKVLSMYYREINFINNTVRNADICLQKYDSLYNYWGDPNAGTERKEDIHHITADYLISNIDHAVRHWQEGRWAKHLTFDEFCEYLLPYRIENENLELWRDTIEKQYLHRITWTENEDTKRNSAYWAAIYLNDQLKNSGFRLENVLGQSSVKLPPSLLMNMKMGTCYDYARSAVYVMRACGVPVGMDFTPQWPFRSYDHAWNVVKTNNGKDVPFMGAESNPGQPNKPDYKMAKAYRYVYGYQKESLFDKNKKKKEQVPALFRTPFLKDVSELYFEPVSVPVTLRKLQGIKTSFAYLTVFNNQKWVPLQWAEIKRGNKAVFAKMGKDIVYLPVYYANGQVVPASFPVLIEGDGTQRSLVPDLNYTQTMVLRRKFPVFSDVFYYSGRVVNARLEASVDPDFRNPVELGVIKRFPLMRYDTIHVQSDKEYRYWRYVSPDNGHTNIAALQFFQKGEDLTPQAKIYSNAPHSGNNLPGNVLDGDDLTYYESEQASGGWLSFDFGKPVSIDKLRYLPRNDDNNITEGNRYELFYFGELKWESLGEVVAPTDSLIYENVPSGGLYLLKNHTRGTEERIFTYENGKQVWW